MMRINQNGKARYCSLVVVPHSWVECVINMSYRGATVVVLA